jgi:membrane-anchored glycerophosphoryl diester phosphodiesterase (GDPDase)
MVEFIIKIYILICLLLIFFQIGFLTVMFVRARIEQYIIKKMRRKILAQKIGRASL